MGPGLRRGGYANTSTLKSPKLLGILRAVSNRRADERSVIHHLLVFAAVAEGAALFRLTMASPVPPDKSSKKQG
jgi:hypothetical protein